MPRIEQKTVVSLYKCVCVWVCLLKPDNNVETINIFLAPPEHTNPLSHACDIREESGEESEEHCDHPKRDANGRRDRRSEQNGTVWGRRGERERGSSSALVSQKNRNITKQTAIYWWVYCKQRLQQCLPISLSLSVPLPHLMISWWCLCRRSFNWVDSLYSKQGSEGHKGGQFVNLVLWQRARCTLNKTDRLLKTRKEAERKKERETE